MPTITKTIANFNNYPHQSCILYRPERYQELINLVQSKSLQYRIARGGGFSYGDASLNKEQSVLHLERLNRMLAFDQEKGIITAEAGVSLAEMLAVTVPKGWFLPVTPGTQHVTLGGCVAADVHGKNHYQLGSFCNHVLWLELITADARSIRCSSEQNPEIFWATSGGMGLTGIIGTVSLKLIPITSSYLTVQHQPCSNLAETLAALSNANTDYSVAWLDSFAKDLGSSVVMSACHTTDSDLQPLVVANKKARFAVPFNAPSWLLNPITMGAYNKVYYYRQARKKHPYFASYQNYFYPLDHIRHWNRMYGKKGFIQYQCVLPFANAEDAIAIILQHLHHRSQPAYLAVLKRFGSANSGLLSFPIPGITLALDLPLSYVNLFKTLDELDEIVAHNGGRVYLAKDARLKPEVFRAMYPTYRTWLGIKSKTDPENMFSSSLSRRLEF